MKILKRTFSCLLAVLLLATSFPAVNLTSFAAASDDPDLVFDSDGTITRAEWIHDLTVVFNMAVTEESMPDNYYSDLSENHKYYYEIISAVEFGVIDIDAGEALYPDEPVTRDFAVSTLNFCLGYQLAENTEYTFSDYENCASPDSAQIALDRDWVELIDGNFAPATIITKNEAETMLDDAIEVLEEAVVDENHENTVEFTKDVIEIPAGTVTSVDKNDVVTITDCPETIAVGDKFAVYYDEIPVVYTATKVTVDGSDTIIETHEVATEEAFKEIDMQGVASADTMEIIPADGVEVSFEDDTSSGASTYAIAKLKKINATVPVTLMPGLTASLNVEISNPYVEYIINTNRAYVALNGDTKISYDVKADFLEMALVPKTISLFNVIVAGVGNFTVSLNLGFSGKAHGTVSGKLTAGIECVFGNEIRAIKQFQQKTYTSNAEATTVVSLKATLGVTKLPVISASVYAEVGANVNAKVNTYSSGGPYKCVHFAAYLFARYGANASIKVDLGITKWSKSFNKNYDIYTASNSPVKFIRHYEDGREVPSCSRGTTYFNYFTDVSSIWGGSGWYGADGAYGLTRDGVPVPLYNYTLNENNEATITKYNYNSWSVNIPSEIDGHTVIAIGKDAFKNKRASYVEIPDTVRTLEQGAFNSCYNLQSVVIPDSVTVIGNYAFEFCYSLRNADLPNALTSLGKQAFAHTAINTVEIPKTLQTVSSDHNGFLFDHEYNGTKYSVGKGPFYNCNYLKTVTFEKGITIIKNDLFAGCMGLEKIEIPDTVTNIEAGAFRDCFELKSVTLSDTVTNIGNNAFYQCVSLPEIIIPNSVTEISGYAFGLCKSLKNVTLSNTLKSLGTQAFESTAIETIEIPKSIETVGADHNGFLFDHEYNGTKYSVCKGPFYNCINLKTVTFEKGITKIENNLFAGCMGLEEIEIPNTVTNIESGAFRDCFNLTSVTISDTVTSIGNDAFNQCLSLPEINIPESITSIEGFAFINCVSLKDVTLSKRLKKIGAQAFTNTAIEKIEIPKSVESYGTDHNGFLFDYEFNGKKYSVSKGPFFNCLNLKEVTFEEGITKMKSGMFAGCMGLEEIVIPDTVTEIEAGAFRDCCYLKSVTIGNSVEKINNDAFFQCLSLEKVNIPESITTLGNNAFRSCMALPTIEIPDSITVLGDSLFEDCFSLESIKLPKDLKYIGSATFKNCSALKNIDIPATVDKIYGQAFSGCKSLESVTFAKDSILKEIHDSAFYNCESLKEIILPESVEKIYKTPFQNCISLEKVYIPQSINTISNGAFMGCSSLSDVTFSDFSISKIENDTFKDCPALQSIVLPKGLESIGSQAFMNGTSLTKVTIPGTVTSIDASAFSYPFKTTIYGQSGSYAETFANDNGFTFESIVPADCNHSETILIDDVAVTCTNNGYTGDIFCNICGVRISTGSQITKLNHTLEVIPGKAATCTETGLTDGEKCSVCGTVTKQQRELPLAHNIEKLPAKSATCTEAGITAGEKCTICETVIKAQTEIPAKGHTFSAWTVTTEATYSNDGEMKRKCYACGETETQAIAKLEATKESVDNNSNITVKYQDNTYTGEMQLEVVQELDGDAFQLLNNEKGDFENILYDITTTINGEKVQPNGSVLVGIPLPEGYNPETTVVYFVSNDGSGLVEMDSYYKDGYIWFETNHFSPYALVDETGAGYKLGDVNGDGEITASDARAALRASAEMDTLEGDSLKAADANKDGEITASDARMILRVSAELDTF